MSTQRETLGEGEELEYGLNLATGPLVISKAAVVRAVSRVELHRAYRFNQSVGVWGEQRQVCCAADIIKACCSTNSTFLWCHRTWCGREARSPCQFDQSDCNMWEGTW